MSEAAAEWRVPRDDRYLWRLRLAMDQLGSGTSSLPLTYVLDLETAHRRIAALEAQLARAAPETTGSARS